MVNDSFSTLFDLLPIGAYRSTPEGKPLRANAALVRMNGYETEAELLDSIQDIGAEWYVQPGRRNDFKTLLQANHRVASFDSEIYRHRTRQTTRERLWVREHAHLVRDQQGNPQYYEGTVEDITEQRRTERLISDRAALFCAVMHTVPDLVWLKDAHGIYQACNAAFERHFGRTSAHILGKTDLDFSGHPVALRLARSDESTLWSGQTALFEEDLPYPDGSGFGTYEIIKAPMRNDLGQIIGELGMARDITDRKRAETQLRDVSEQFELALISAELGMWTQHLNPSTHPQYEVDTRAQVILGLVGAKPLATLGDAAATSWTDGVHPDDLPAALGEMKRHLAGQNDFFEAEYRVQQQPSGWKWVSSRGKVVQFSAQGEPLKVMGTLMDIDGRKGAEEAIRQMAFQDSLTGLPNRRLLVDRLQQALTASERHKRCGALLFLDLDKFKRLNDNFGHDVGDLLLQQVATRILHSVRAVDTVARIGGDEFVVLIADLAEDADSAKAHATKVGEKILSALNEPYELGELRHISTPSIGATVFSGIQHSPSDVLRQADMAMYEAKAKGRNTLRFYQGSFDAEIG